MVEPTGSPMLSSAEKEGFKKTKVPLQILHSVIDKRLGEWLNLLRSTLDKALGLNCMTLWFR